MFRHLVMVLVITGLSASTFAGYVQDREAAVELRDGGKYEKALSMFMKMAEAAEYEKQQIDALEQAAMCAVKLNRDARVKEIAEQIPSEDVRRYVLMRHKLSKRDWQGVLAEFKDDRVSEWPDRIAGEAFYDRGRAAHFADANERAVSDFKRALEYPLPHTDVGHVYNALGGAYRQLGQDDKAIRMFRKTVKESGWYRACQASIQIARILSARGKHEQALAEMRQYKLGDFHPHYRVMILQARGDVLVAQGKKEAAVARYRQALAVDAIRDHMEQRIEKSLEALKGQAPEKAGAGD